MHWTSGRTRGMVAGAAAVLLAMSECLTLAWAQQSPPAPAAPQVPAAPAARFVVVIDAAHGGDDTGGHLSDGQLEKSANLAFSVRLRSLLGARGIQGGTTREADQSLE